MQDAAIEALAGVLDVPAVRVGRSFRVPEKAVHEYLRAAFIEAG